MKTKGKVFVFVSLVPTIIFFGFVYKVYQGLNELETLNEATWDVKRQIILAETYSPDRTKKIGSYHYDAGGLGYTSIQISIVPTDQRYPLMGNLYSADNIPINISWRDSSKAEIEIRKDYYQSQKVDTLPAIKIISGTKISFKFGKLPWQ
jgi:hypothetical protein